jgi:hypothetical protein
MRLVVSLLIGLIVTGSPGVSEAQSQDPHVRPLQKDAERVLAAGMAKSDTFRRLIARLERSDVIVYVDLRWQLPLRLAGRLQFLAKHGDSRYLLVELSRTLPRRAQVAILGHELQHAVEVAEADDVCTPEGLRALYRRVGVQTGPDTYDSMAARRAGYDVLREETSGGRDGSQRAGAADLSAMLPASD